MRLLRIPVAAVVVFAFLLLAAARFLGLRVPGPKAVLYFSALGAGFIMCEVAMIQRLILLLGHPIYTFVVILFAFLLGGGLGSLFAKRFATERIKDALKWIIIGVILLTVLGAFALPKLVHAAIPLDLTLRIIVAGALALPMGFLMGMPFPLGLRMSAQDPNGAPLSALWGLNGVASVVGSLAGMVLAIVAGFTWVFLASALCYAVAWTTRP
jgi:predicted membrane-bound spermidine synthase